MSATISLLFGLLVAIVILATLATRLRIPYTTWKSNACTKQEPPGREGIHQ